MLKKQPQQWTRRWVSHTNVDANGGLSCVRSSKEKEAARDECNVLQEIESVSQSVSERLISILRKTEAEERDCRYIIGLAGVPGSGKTTLAVEACVRANNAVDGNPFLALPMDGFHYHTRVLDEQGLRRRGSCFTFDAESLVASARRIKSYDSVNNGNVSNVYWPSFDHSVGDPIEKGFLITNEHKVILLEGNYLLMGAGPYPELKELDPEWNERWDEEWAWAGLDSVLDEGWFLDCRIDVAMERLVKRHILANNNSEEEARGRVEVNDGINAMLISKSFEQRVKDSHAIWVIRNQSL